MIAQYTDEFNTLEKTVCLIVTDLHLHDRNIRGRRDYTAESKFAWSTLLSTVDRYLSEDYKVYVLFLGDIYNNSYLSVTDATLANNNMVALKAKVHYIGAVVGNHETTYFTDNPFWTLMTKLTSQRMYRYQGKTWAPLGVIDIIDVPDVLRVGNIDFYFNHFDTEVYTPSKTDGILNVGLFHKDVYNKSLLEYTKSTYGLQPFEHNVIDIDGAANPLHNYDHALVGHAHMLYGEWTHYNENTGHTCILHHLSTLGRTNEREVSDTFLERDIPAYILHNGKFVRKESNKFNLLTRSDSIIEEVVEKNREVYAIQKERKLIRSQKTYLGKTGDPVEDVKANIDPEDKISMVLFSEAVGNSATSMHDYLTRKARGLLGVDTR